MPATASATPALAEHTTQARAAGPADRRRHVVVIGAGIVGTVCAIEMLRSGRQVTLLNPHAPAGEEATSYGNAGWLSSHSILPPAGPGMWKQVPGYLRDPQGPLTVRWGYLPRALPWLWRFLRSGRTPAHVARTAHALRQLLRDAPALHARLASEAGVPHLVAQRGLLHAYRSRADFEADALGWRLRGEEGIAFETVEGASLRAQEPDLAPAYGFSVRVAEAGHCANPGAYLAALVAHAQSLGARWVTGQATGLHIEAGRLHAVRTDQGDLPCQGAVIAAGAYSRPLALAAGDRVWLDTERGYHAMLDLQARAGEPAPAGPRTSTMVMDRKLIVHQMEHGLRVAGQVEIAGLHAAPDWRRARILLGHLFDLYPSLPRATLEDGARFWMGRRPSTSDGLPCIGPASACTDVIHAYGHGHVGLGASARTGRVVSQCMDGQPPEIDLAPFRPQRWRR
ncbi:FAD-dependent oxidoreductase [Acidovorax sp. SUPP1855]|uniref:NAD(P)/FAD-dependent oxidoreductase n=1 Tax=Acidovorax sp. SUPP1855 TaxID=431774 RepID=UPI0023DE5A0C|nr:FAD-dependent oxidoreductase [Acidovorax sp. SUPP1855]GKS84636.1 FAD-dependent oxidoreductase [Acidovorax sp. SUPP1855]